MYLTHLTLFAASILPAANVVARSFPRANQCDVKGYDASTESYYYDDSGKNAGYAKCSAHCLKETDCQSFAYDNANTCMHFKASVSGNFESDDDSPFHFYDRSCVLSISTASTTTTIKGTTSSTMKMSTSTGTNTSMKTTTKTLSISTSSTSYKITTSSATKAATTKLTTTATRTTTTNATSKAITTTTITKSTTPSSTAVSIPSGCPLPALYTISSFHWFNSTHNLDCASAPDIGDGTGCINAGPNGETQWCDPKKDKDCTNCGIAVCSTGLPPQPLGYGPPDDVKFTFADGSTCEQMNPAVVHRYEVGNGFVLCGGAYDFMNFYGSSNAASQMGRVEINGYPTQCADGDTIYGYYNTQFQIDCTHDKQFNATCSTPSSFTIPLVSFSKGKL